MDRGPNYVDRLVSAGHVDGDAGDEVGVGRGQKADHLRLVGRLGDAAQRRAVDLLGLLMPPGSTGPSAAGCARSGCTLGAIALTLMPSGPSSKASLRVKAMMPPLAAA